jgi:RNA polymerase sigma-70 factor (ECF subfamily)
MDRFIFDGEYVARLRDGDAATQRHFTSYFGDLLRIKLAGRVRSHTLVEDARQETFLRVFAALRQGKLQQPERLGAFVNSVCNNVTLELFRSEGRHPPIDDDTPEQQDHRENPEQHFVTKQNREQVASLLKKLPEKDRDLLKQIFWQERDRDEICREFGVDRNYLRVLVHRAKTRVREILEARAGTVRGAGA